MTTRKLKKHSAPSAIPDIKIPQQPAVKGMHLIIYTNCPPEKEFVLQSGERLKNLFELAEKIAAIDQHTFSHHVTHERNDFANWIEHVFGEKDLAQALRKSETRELHEIKLLRHLLGKLLDHEKKN